MTTRPAVEAVGNDQIHSTVALYLTLEQATSLQITLSSLGKDHAAMYPSTAQDVADIQDALVRQVYVSRRVVRELAPGHPEYRG